MTGMEQEKPGVETGAVAEPEVEMNGEVPEERKTTGVRKELMH